MLLRFDSPSDTYSLCFEIVAFDDVRVTHPADERVGSKVYTKESNYINFYIYSGGI